MIEAYDNSEDVEEMIALSRKMEEFLYDDASFVPGFVLPFLRVGVWRWMEYPDDFAVKITDEVREYRLGWIDQEKKEKTLAAMRNGETFEPVVQVIDTYAPASVKSN